MILESALREKLAALASGAIPLEDFADWVDDESWNMHSDSTVAAIDLASSIHALLAERDASAIDDAALRIGLLSLLNNVQAVFIGTPIPQARPAASSAQWVRPARWVLPASA